MTKRWGLTSTQRRRKQLLQMYVREKGLCHWCKKPCFVPEPGTHYGKAGNPHDLATIDHLDDRFSPERGKHPGEIRRVMACHECNQRRCNESLKANVEEQRRRAAARNAKAARA